MTMQTLLTMFGDDAKLTEYQAAEYLQLRPATLRQWRHQKIGPVYFKVGGRIRYEFGQLRQFDARATAA